MKGANSLFGMGDERLTKYNEQELGRILGDNRYHSPEDLETDLQGSGKRKINVYNSSWRSDEIQYFFL